MNTASILIIVTLAAVASSAETVSPPEAGLSQPPSVNWDSALLVGSLGRACPFFAPGEEMVFTIRLEGVAGDVPPDTYFVDWERRGDDGATEKGRVPLEVSYRGASHADQPAPAGGPHDRIRFKSNGHGFDLGKGTGYVREFFASICKPGFEYGWSPAGMAKWTVDGETGFA